MEGSVRFDQGKDLKGPLTIAAVLTHDRQGSDASAANPATPRPTQRIAVFGDGDFLSNSYLGNGANLELGNRLINWLSNDDSFIAIRAKSGPDQTLTLSTTVQALIGAGFLFGVPLILISSGFFIWMRRRKR